MCLVHLWILLFMNKKIRIMRNWVLKYFKATNLLVKAKDRGVMQGHDLMLSTLNKPPSIPQWLLWIKREQIEKPCTIIDIIALLSAESVPTFWNRDKQDLQYSCRTRALIWPEMQVIRYKFNFGRFHEVSNSMRIPDFFKHWGQRLLWFISRAVFKWLSKNQHQSNYSDQSQQEQAARWTNHSS